MQFFTLSALFSPHWQLHAPSHLWSNKNIKFLTISDFQFYEEKNFVHLIALCLRSCSWTASTRSSRTWRNWNFQNQEQESRIVMIVYPGISWIGTLRSLLETIRHRQFIVYHHWFYPSSCHSWKDEQGWGEEQEENLGGEIWKRGKLGRRYIWRKVRVW